MARCFRRRSFRLIPDRRPFWASPVLGCVSLLIGFAVMPSRGSDHISLCLLAGGFLVAGLALQRKVSSRNLMVKFDNS